MSEAAPNFEGLLREALGPSSRRRTWSSGSRAP